MFYSYLDSPVGRLMVAGSDDALHQLSFDEKKSNEGRVPPNWERKDDCFNAVAAQLEEYFDGKRKVFELQLRPSDQSDTFSARVWRELQNIPYGETRSYRYIAERIERPKAYRAVGQANHRNPIAIVIPCHRVIGSDGSLTGFGGGLETKKYLLNLEAATEIVPA